MPLLRERTKIAPRKQITESNFDTKWTLQEKKKLLVALRKLKPENTEQIRSEYLPHRTEKEIFWFIERMKNKPSRKPDVSRPRVPIELWENMAEDLTGHDVDFSYAMAEVFHKIAEEEEHFPKNLLENPDWKLIYLYLVSLLKGDEPPEVGQIEAVVLLDLTEALAKYLKSLDTTDQRSIMIKKYELLAARVNARSSEEVVDLTRKALEEDPLALSAGQEIQPGTSSGISPPSDMPQQSAEASTPQTKATTAASQKKVSTGQRVLGARSRPGRKKKSEISPVVSDLQKTSLYSINPFCIPIRYLNPKVKQPTPVKEAVATATDAAPTSMEGQE